QLVGVAAVWPAGGEAPLPASGDDDRRAVERLEDLFAEARDLPELDARAREDVLASAPRHFAALWPHVEAEADAQAPDAERLLKLRGRAEADALRALLASQLEAGRSALEGRQLAFDFGEKEKAQREQYEEDRKYLRGRLEGLKKEMDREPRAQVLPVLL